MRWSDALPTPGLVPGMAPDGGRRLGFGEADGRPLHLRGLDGATLRIDTATGQIGAPGEAVGRRCSMSWRPAPDVAPHAAATASAAIRNDTARCAAPTR